MVKSLQLFESHMNVYLLDLNIQQKKKQVLKILRGVGDEGMRKINNSSLSETDKQDPDKIWKLFKEQLKINNLNYRVYGLEFENLRQNNASGETLDEFVNRIKPIAAKCDFDPLLSLIVLLSKLFKM